MALIYTLSSPLILLSNSSACQRNIVASKKKLCSPRAKLNDDNTLKTTLRRSANYAPTLWSNDFIQSLSSEYTVSVQTATLLV